MQLRNLLIAAFIAATVTPIAAQDPRVEACRKLMTNTAPSPAVMQILEPGSDVTIFGNELTMRVALPRDDPKIDHWHLWANGELQVMVYGEAATIELAPGTYEVCAILGHIDHADVGLPDVMTVTMLAAAEGTPTTSPSELALQSAANSTTVIEGDPTGQMILILVAAVLAAVGGWVLGRRLPKSKTRK